MSANKQSPVGPGGGPIWVHNHIAAGARGVELAHARYIEVMADAANPRKPLDSYVEIRNWAISMRWLCRAAEAAKSLQLPAVDAAVALFEAKVNVGDVALFRDRLEHADDYAAGLGRNYKRWPDVDFDGWTAAAQALRAAIEQELRPAPKPKT